MDAFYQLDIEEVFGGDGNIAQNFDVQSSRPHFI
jgi:hypothetical protein